MRLLRMAAFLRAAAHGMALVDVSLYLRSLGWSGGAIGGVLAAAGIVRAALSLGAGRLNAWLGAKRMLLLFEALTAVGAAAAAAAAQPAVLAAAVIAAGLGSGHSGAAGPAAPIERAWLAAHARRSGAGPLIAIQTRIGWFGMAAGDWLACAAALGGGAHAGPNAYRPVFGLLALLSACGAALLLRTKGGKRRAGERPAEPQPRAAMEASSASSSTLPTEHSPATAPLPRTQLSLPEPAATVEGPARWASARVYMPAICCALAIFLAIALRHAGLRPLSLYAPIAVFLAAVALPFARLPGRRRSSARAAGRRTDELKRLAHLLGVVSATLTSTMTSYWFSAKFDASLVRIAALMGCSYAGAGLLSMLFEQSSKRRGTLAAVVAMQTVSVALLLVLPWASAFWLAAALEIGCTACSLGTRGGRMELQAERGGKRERSPSFRAYYLTVRFGAALWPGAFGRLVDEGQYVVPFYIAAVLQAGSTYAYARLDGERERGAETASGERGVSG